MQYNYLRKSTVLLIGLMATALLFAQGKQAKQFVPNNSVRHVAISQNIPDSIIALDSIPYLVDALDHPDQTPEDSTKKAGVINIPVVYSADDSISITSKGVAQLYGKGSVSYGELSIVSDYIRFTMDSSLVHAHGVPDTTGKVQEPPKFKEGSEEYVADVMDYNLKTKKGFIVNTTSKQGEGFVTSRESKKDSANTICMIHGRYTTCDNHDDPDFYIALTKAKVNPGKSIISGPAYLVIEDVPLPLFIPFGYFPSNSSYSSGVLMPSFGQEQTRGYYLQGGGYYWAMSQYNDLAIRGDYFANQSWAIRATSKYRSIYRFTGNVGIDYQVTKISEKGLNDYGESTDFKIVWNHSQDTKASPYSTFSAGVNYSSSSYTHNNMNTYYDPSLISNNATFSSVTYTKRWPESPWTLNSSINASQNTRDSTVSMSLPQLSIAMARIYPFKRKLTIGAPLWYEKIGITYSGNLKNSITTKEDELMHKSLIKDWNNGVEHKLSTSTSFQLFNIFTLSPSIQYNERWYTSSIRKSYNDSTNLVNQDTVYGFHRAYDYSFSVGTSTTLYGFFRPINMVNKLLFGDRIEAIRHVMTPSVSLGYRPDFGDPKYGYYQHYSTVAQGANGFYAQDHTYSIYDGSIFGSPSSGKSGSVSFSLGNMIDMKLRKKPGASSDATNEDDEDPTSKEAQKSKFKKITLLESLNFGTSYNMLADSMAWSNIQMSGRTTLFKTLAINFSGAFDPYSYVQNDDGSYSRVNTPYFKTSGHSSIARLISANVTTGYSFSNDTFKRKKKKEAESKAGAGFDSEDAKLGKKTTRKSDKSGGSKESQVDEYGYLPFAMPWTLTVNYSINWMSNPQSFDAQKMAFNLKMSQILNFHGTLALTDKWRFNISSGYDFTLKNLSLTSIGFTRNLHCWTLSGSVIPLGAYKSYNITIAVSSSVLQDLKWNTRSDPRLNPDF